MLRMHLLSRPGEFTIRMHLLSRPGEFTIPTYYLGFAGAISLGGMLLNVRRDVVRRRRTEKDGDGRMTGGERERGRERRRRPWFLPKFPPGTDRASTRNLAEYETSRRWANFHTCGSTIVCLAPTYRPLCYDRRWRAARGGDRPPRRGRYRVRGQ